jgi:hypothetical protein
LQPIISWRDNPVYVETVAQLKKAGRLPEGFSAVGIILQEGWSPESLVWDLNSLFGGTFADEPFRVNSGARAFSFRGERAGKAHELCDVLRDGWFHRGDTDENIVLTMGDDADSIEDLIESVMLILLAPGYLDNWKYCLFLAPDDDSLREVRAQIAQFVADMEEGRRGH